MTKPISPENMEFVEVDDLKIRFQRNQGGSGVPLLLTSPWPESLYAYQRMWPTLGAEAPLIAVDIPGLANQKADRN